MNMGPNVLELTRKVTCLSGK